MCTISSQEPSKWSKTKNKAQVKQGNRREAIAAHLTRFTQICHFRSTEKCAAAKCLSRDWKTDARILRACCKKAYVVVTMQGSSSQPVAHRISWDLGLQLRQKSLLSEGYTSLRRHNPLRWKTLGTCSSKKRLQVTCSGGLYKITFFFL